MAVPKMSQLRPGVRVNIVLKADQRSGRLTNGSISEILTHGDHPRGIKVRLNNGQVGRVQSLTPSQLPTGSTSDTSVHLSPTPVSSETYNIEHRLSQYDSRRGGFGGRGGRHALQGGFGGRGGRHALQDDYRQDPTPLEPRSLADYVRFPSSPIIASASITPVEEPALQAQMEAEFPKLDSALIAAIVSDYSDPAEAKGVLSVLS